jgi:hypothetical protein
MTTYSISYYIHQIHRLTQQLVQIQNKSTSKILEFRDIHSPMRWIPCSICTTQCFRSREHSIMTEICKNCQEALQTRVIQYSIKQIEKGVVQEQKKRVHEQLLDFCFRPEYVAKTGCLETCHLFNGSEVMT